MPPPRSPYFLASLVLLLLPPAVLQARQQEILFDHLSVEDGLSHNSVYAIHQDRTGFMWFATEDGLNKYDGYRFTVYRTETDNPNSLSNNWVEGIFEDREGMLWFATDYGINRFDPETERFDHLFHDPKDARSLGNDDTRLIYQDRSGVLWVGTEGGGLNRFDPDTGTFTRFLHDPDDSRSLSHNEVLSIAEDPTGALWVGTRGGGLNRFDPETGAFTRFLYDPDDPGSLSDNRVRTLYEDRSGVLWVGTDGGGLNRFDPDTGTFTRFLSNPGNPNSLSSNAVYALYEDRSGILWVGTVLGALNRFDTEAGYFTRFSHDQDNPNSLNDNSVASLYEDPRVPEVLWIGTAEGGLNRFDRKAGTFTHFLHDPRNPNSLSDNFVEAVYRDGDGVLWVGTRNGLNEMRRDGKSFAYYLNGHPDPPYNWVRFIYEAPSDPGMLWLSGGKRGLLRFDRRKHTYETFRNDPDDPRSLSADWVSSIYEDHAGVLWIATEGGGLNRLDRSAGDASRPASFTRYQHDPDDPGSLRSNDLYAIYEAPAGILWLATARGLSRFDTAAGSFTHFTRQNSDLPNEVIYGILGDEEGNLWLSTLGGLSRFNPETRTFSNFDVDRGVQARAFNPFAYFKSPSGELFFGGINGFNAFFPRQIRGNRHPPQVVITEMERFNRSAPPGEPKLRPVRLSGTDAVTLSHTENDLSFSYVGLHYANPSRNQYAYRLEHYEEDWHYVGAQRIATYTNLDPGEYVFHVIAANRDGVWNQEGASVRIVINPPWWQTPWAYTLYVLLLLAGIFAVDRTQRARLIRKERERAQIREAELRAEAAELQAQAVQARARALQAENERKEHELEKARELEAAYRHLKATQEQLIQAEKMASLGQLTAGIAHEIKNPLNFVNNFAELNAELADELGETLAAARGKNLDDVADTLNDLLQDLKTNAEQINKHGKRADGIVRSMLMHSRGTPGERGPTDVNQLLEEYVNLSYHGMRANQPGFNVTIERRYDETLGTVPLVPQEMGRVFLNLLNNAFYAVHEKARARGGAYAPTVSVCTERHADHVAIRIRDNGTGIPAAMRSQIFQPFFTTKPTGTGTGLGLSLSYDIVVQGHRGQLTVESEEGVFTEFTITLPLDQTGGPS